MSEVTEKPWGNENLIFQGFGYAVKKITLNANQKTSLHFHEIKHETIMVHEGELRIFIDDRISVPTTIILTSGNSLAITPEVIHQMSTGGSQAVYFEAQTDHLTDVIRLKDDYGRV
jgi:mannose-6-phosphate isomerase-like protein (cupin superfamily)